MQVSTLNLWDHAPRAGLLPLLSPFLPLRMNKTKKILRASGLFMIARAIQLATDHTCSGNATGYHSMHRSTRDWRTLYL